MCLMNEIHFDLYVGIDIPVFFGSETLFVGRELELGFKYLIDWQYLGQIVYKDCIFHCEGKVDMLNEEIIENVEMLAREMVVKLWSRAGIRMRHKVTNEDLHIELEVKTDEDSLLLSRRNH